MSKDKLPWFPLYPSDFLNDEKVKRMSDAALGVYFKALCLAWMENGLPLDEEHRRLVLGLESSAYAQLWPEIQDCWVVGKGKLSQRIFNPRLERERSRGRKVHASAVKRGKLGGRPRSSAKAERKPSLSPAKAQPKPSRVQSHIQSQSQSQVQKKKENPLRAREKDPHAEAFKDAFDTEFPESYDWHKADFIQLARWRKKYPDVMPEQFADLARHFWSKGQYTPKLSLSIRGLCGQWAQLSALRQNDPDAVEPSKPTVYPDSILESSLKFLETKGVDPTDVEAILKGSNFGQRPDSRHYAESIRAYALKNRPGG